MKLYWELLDKGVVIPYLTVLIIGLTIKDNIGPVYQAFLVCFGYASILSTGNDIAHYRAAGLPVKLWRTHMKVSAAILWAVGVGLFVWKGMWIAAGLITIPLIARLLSTPEPKVSRAEALVQNSDGSREFGRFPVTPVAQLIYRPLIRTWVICWIVFVGSAGIAIGYSYVMGEKNPESGFIAILPILVMATFLATQFRDSLRDFLRMGGTRAAWSKAAGASTLVNVCLAAVVTLIAWVAVGIWSPAFLLVGLLLPVIQFSSEFARHVMYAGFLTVASLAGVIVWMMGSLSDVAVLALATGLYALWLATLPWRTRTLDVFGAGLPEFFGISMSQKA